MPVFARSTRRGQFNAAFLCVALWLVANSGSMAADAASYASSVLLHRLRTGHLAVEVAVGGQTLRMVVDTACPVTVIDQSAYRRLQPTGPASALPSGVKPLRSLNGQPTETGWLPELRIGATSLGGLRVAVAGLDTVLGNQFARGSGVDGILGTDVLACQAAVVDLGHGTLSVATTRTQRTEIARQSARTGGTAVPMAPTNGGHFAVPCIVSGDPGRLVVDTGSPYTVVQRTFVAPEALARPGRVVLMHTLSGATSVAWIPLEHWSIGAFPVTRAPVGTGNFRGGIFAEHTRTGGQVAGLFGLELLTHWSAIIDFGSRTIYLKHP